MTMKICIDIQSAIAQQAGVGRYTRRLVDHLGPIVSPDSLKLFYFDFKRQGLPFEVPGSEQLCSRLLPGRLVQKAWKSIHWPPYELFAGPADLYHFPNFIIPPLGTKALKSVTIHDMSFMRHPEFAEEKNRAYLQSCIGDTVKRADLILTDSAFSAGEISEFTHVPSDRIFPIHLGVTDDFTPASSDQIDAARRQLNLDKPYLLSVSTLEPRKNTSFLIDVFEQLDEFDGDLVIAGMRGWKYEATLKRMQESPKASRIRFLEYVDDQLLPALYSGCELFLFPSHYEGFGLTPLEAMKCGSAVISSPGGSLREVVSGGAVVLETSSPDPWVNEIKRLLLDETAREALIEQGIQHAGTFSWDKTARETLAVFRQAAS
jgi:glycosyltransferase involved in cell wall biosynthesis